MADQQQNDRPKFAKVTLEEPIKRGDEEIAEITIRRPDAGSLRGVSMAELIRMEAGAVMTVLPRVTMPPLIDAEVAQLDPADLFACSVELSTFFMKREELAAFPTT